jgi:putative peptide zinc metalloprotease protein
MVSLADSLVSSSARKLPIRKRPDLSAKIQRYQGRSYWVVKDPVGLNYFRFQEEEYAILNMLDGQSSLDDIRQRFEAAFPPQKITVEELQQFIGMLHRSGLVITAAPGQGQQLKKRHDERKRKELLSKFTNLLAIRFKGIDPERFLNWFYPKVRFFFHPLGVAAWIIICLSAVLLVAVQFDVFQSKLPSFHQFFGPQNWFWLALALGLTKVLHELGHGLTCKHFGGECHEIGVMILVLTPCLYCNVSDSWMLPSKWARAMIGAAGMYVEFFLAAVATFVWWFSEPGLLNQLSLSTMFVCSVSTLLFNANPLLRYDGYYILADIVEIPNLRQKATKILSQKLGKWCLGLEEQEDPFLPKRNQFFFATYTVLAVAYRWFILFSILYFLYLIFKPYGLQIIGQAIGAVSIIGLVVVPMWKVGKFFYVPGRIDKVKKPRMYATLGILAAIMLAIVYVPLPHSVMATFEIRPREGTATPVYADPGGILAAVYVQPGERVAPGKELAVFENDQIEMEILRLKSLKTQYEARLASLLREGHIDPQAQLEIPETRKSIASTRQQLEQWEKRKSQLVLRAPHAGTVLPAPSQTATPEVDGRLPTWSGSPFQPKNLGAHIQRQQVCWIGDPNRWEAMLVVDQADIEFVRPGQKAWLLMEQMPLSSLATSVEDVSPEPLAYAPRHLSNKAGGELATETDVGGEKPQSPQYQARSVELDTEYAGLLRMGLRGQAKIRTDPQTLWSRFWRFVRQTFNFKL